MSGFVFIDKPRGPSSFAIVTAVRKTLNIAKAGHCGTLDPQASGLLICATGAATRLIPYLATDRKAYDFRVRFGAETDTLDAEGAVIADGGAMPLRDDLENVQSRFIGRIAQTPPRYSAVKIGGKRAYRLARSNDDFDLESREITIHTLSLRSYDAARQEAVFCTECSAGTYIRSLARDIAHALGTMAYATAIRRTGIGPYSVNQAVDLDTFSRAAADALIPAKQIFSHEPAARLNHEQAQDVLYGKDVILAGKRDDRLFLYTPGDDLVAVADRVDHDRFHPVKVFASL